MGSDIPDTEDEILIKLQSELSNRTSALTLELEKQRMALPACEAFINEYLGKGQKVEVTSANNIKYDHVPTIQVDCKATKHWKTFTSVVVGGGARVNVMSKHTRKGLSIMIMKPTPFKVQITDQQVV